MADIIIEGKNEEAFEAVLQAFSTITGNDVVPMSNWSVEPDDSTKTVQIGAKVHVPSGQRSGIRDRVADYLETMIEQNRLQAEKVIIGTKSKPNKAQFDLVIRYELDVFDQKGEVRTEKQRKPQVIRIEIKPENTGGARGGSDNTTIQEFALAVFLAIRYQKGSDLVFGSNDADLCLDENDYVYGLSMVDGRNKPTSNQIIELDSTWKRSCVEGANEIAKTVNGSGWRFLRGDTKLDDGAIKEAYKRCRNEPVKSGLADENKWNPSDIWMVKDGQQDTLVQLLNNEGTIDCLNNFISLAFSIDSFENKSGKNVPARSLIGISLKKLGRSVTLKIMNPVGRAQLQKAQGIVFNKNASVSFLTSFSAMDVYLMYGTGGRDNSFQCRNFAGGSSGDWKLELQGPAAAQGKVQGKVARDLLDAAGFINIPQESVDDRFTGECRSSTEREARNTYENKKGKRMTNPQKELTNEIYKLLKKYTAKGFSTKTDDEIDMKIAISMKDASWRFSKISGLRMLDWLCTIGAGRASRAMKELYLYASSQTEKSSVHYKLY